MHNRENNYIKIIKLLWGQLIVDNRCLFMSSIAVHLVSGVADFVNFKALNKCAIFLIQEHSYSVERSLLKGKSTKWRCTGISFNTFYKQFLPLVCAVLSPSPQPEPHGQTSVSPGWLRSHDLTKLPNVGGSRSSSESSCSQCRRMQVSIEKLSRKKQQF